MADHCWIRIQRFRTYSIFQKYDPVDYNNDTRLEMLTVDFDNDTLRGIDAVPLDFESNLSVEV